MHDERPDASERPKTREHDASCEHEHEHEHDAEYGHEHGHDQDHPAIRRLHAEFAAARDGMASITRLTLPVRQRVVDEIRAGLPDIAGWAAHEAGPDAAVAEIRRFSYLGAEHSDEACPVVLLWGEILENATVAASAAR
jgi:hypothetical protein